MRNGTDHKKTQEMESSYTYLNETSLYIVVVVLRCEECAGYRSDTHAWERGSCVSVPDALALSRDTHVHMPLTGSQTPD